MRKYALAAVPALLVALLWGATAAAQTQDDTDTFPTTALQNDTDTSSPTLLVGTLRLGFDQFFEGVEITVEDSSGNRVGQATTDSGGRWSVEVPGEGTYLVTLNEDTLPEGVGLRENSQPTVEVTAGAGTSQGVVFAVGDAPKGTPFSERFAQTVFNGFKFGLIIAMSAVGLSLVYGTTGLVNFAHGELVTFGAVIAWYFNSSWEGST